MNLKQLEIFESVAKYGSFSKAAKELYLTQPTVSSHIVSLEEELHCQLLVRTTKEVHLTEKGEMLLGYARKMNHLEKEIRAAFTADDDKEAYTLSIAASTIPGQFILPEALTAFRKDHPHIRLEIREGDSDEVAEAVLNGSVEVGFAGTVSNRRRCVNIPFYQDELVIVTPARANYKKLEGEFTVDMIREERLVMREKGSGTRKETEAFLEKAGIDPEQLNIVASFSSLESIKNSVKKGMGVAILSRVSVEDEVRDGKLLAFPFPGEPLYRNLYIITAKRYATGIQARRLIEYIQEKYPVPEW